MTGYIQVVIVCVSLLSIYISILARRHAPMDQYIRFFLGYLALHATHAWIVRTYFPDNMRLDYYAPYGLSYGPFLYFAYHIASGKPLKKRRILLHGLPFLFFWLCYFLWMGFPSLFSNNLRVFGLILYGTLALSLFSYAIWALFFKSIGNNISRNDEVRMISVMAIILAFIAIVFLVFTYSSIVSGYIRSQFKGSVVYLTMLSAALILFSHIVKRVVGNSNATDKQAIAFEDIPLVSSSSNHNASQSEPNERYQKSAVSGELLAAYELEVRRVVEDQNGYLDEELSLESLAQQLRIPKHHLSQVFSIRIEKSFNLYINEHRINHAIALMHDRPEMSITEIYSNSGFTAKASFNRYFKQFQGCTPSEYRLKIQDM